MDAIDDERRALIDELGYRPAPARVTATARGFCSYCGEDLLVSGAAYGAHAVSNLIPAAVIPELGSSPANQVLACAWCDAAKGSHNPLRAWEDPLQMLRTAPDELIERIRKRLATDIERRDRERRRAAEIVRGARGRLRATG